ncbi:MAG TPA: nucleotide-binding protein [Leptospiraceae bacterium]|nr:nucleotide-binding protein [Leptospiraceae bacterium]
MTLAFRYRQCFMTEPHKSLTLFYSWQSDLPANTNRGFIEKALQTAIEEIAQDHKIKITIYQDSRESANPEALSKVLGQIDHSAVFVADVTPVDKSRGHLLPNPNVMFELGYAMKSLGADRIIAVHNDFFGDTRFLPFDLGFQRQTTYNLSPEAELKSEERKPLAKQIASSLRTILSLT